MKNLYLLIVITLVLSSCSKKAIVRFSQRPPELTSADVLTEIMIINKSPRIVLRVPDTRAGVTNNQGTGYVNPVRVNRSDRSKVGSRVEDTESDYNETAIYNAIEKQLFKEGFSVRDRGLFNEVVGGASDYSKISSLTNTDLILELVRLDNPVGYTTNACYLDYDDERKVIKEYRNMGGASVEFKLVHVKTNEIVGSYKIHYTPCLSGCRGLYKKSGSSGVFTNAPWLKPGEKAELRKLSRKPYQALDQDELEAFIADATHQLVQTMR